MARAILLSPPERFLLDQWARTLRETFGQPYLVGSVVRTQTERRYRDVDVRILLEREAWLSLVWCVDTLNAAISIWGQKATGLPIDFQFQRAIRAPNGIRIPIGIIPDRREERESDAELQE